MKNTLLVIIVGAMLMFVSYQSGQVSEWKRLYTTTRAQLDLATERLHEQHTNTLKGSMQ